MKFKKMLGSILATCMLVAALPASLAADNTVPASKYAGQSVTCQIFDEGDDGEMTSRLISVDIPAGATQAEETALVLAAAYPQPRSTRGTVDILSTLYDVTITTKSTNVGEAIAKQNYARIHASFDIETMGGNTTISVHCRNNTTGDQSPWQVLDVNQVIQKVIFTTNDVAISADDSISVNARTNIGTAVSGTCMVQGSTF